MDKVKKVYVDSMYRTNDSESNSDFKFELNQAFDLHDNTVCYVVHGAGGCQLLAAYAHTW